MTSRDGRLIDVGVRRVPVEYDVQLAVAVALPSAAVVVGVEHVGHREPGIEEVSRCGDPLVVDELAGGGGLHVIGRGALSYRDVDGEDDAARRGAEGDVLVQVSLDPEGGNPHGRFPRLSAVGRAPELDVAGPWVGVVHRRHRGEADALAVQLHQGGAAAADTPTVHIVSLGDI